MQPLTRRRFLAGAAMVTAGLPLVTACSAPGSAPAGQQAPAAQQPQVLRVMINGGAYEQNARRIIFEPFKQANNIQIEITPATSAEMLTRFRAEKAAPTIDLVVWDDLVAVGGRADGLVEQIDPANVPNMKDLDPQADYKDGFGPAVHANVVLFAYNRELVKVEPPRSWKEMWDPKFKGLLSMASVNLSSGILAILHTAMLNGGSYENVDPAFEAIKRLQPNIVKFYNTVPEISTMLRTEPAILVSGTNQAYPLVAEGLPIATVFPEGGSPAFPAVVDIIKGTKAKPLAEKLMNAFLEPAAQAAFVKDAYFVAYNKKAQIAPEAQARIPKKLIVYDPVKIARNREQWAARWKREIGD